MRINKSDKQLIKSQIKALLVNTPQVSHCDIARKFNLSRLTVSRWMQEIRNEQIKAIDSQTIQKELWTLSYKAKLYGKAAEQIKDSFSHIWADHPQVFLNYLKFQWNIEKDVYYLKLDLVARNLMKNQLSEMQLINNQFNKVNNFHFPPGDS